MNDREIRERAPQLKCPECGGIMCLKTGQYGWFYGCVRWPECRAIHSAHKSGPQEGLPLGIPADAETRKLRIEVHVRFDRLWRTKEGRRRAYAVMAGHLGISTADCHISRFDKGACLKAIGLLEQGVVKREVPLFGIHDHAFSMVYHRELRTKWAGPKDIFYAGFPVIHLVFRRIRGFMEGEELVQWLDSH